VSIKTSESLAGAVSVVDVATGKGAVVMLEGALGRTSEGAPGSVPAGLFVVAVGVEAAAVELPVVASFNGEVASPAPEHATAQRTKSR
jgi:hypothetical protein